MTTWMLLLGTSIVLPIAILLGTLANDLSGQIAVADGERQGLVSLAAMGALFSDASAFAAAGCSGSSKPVSAAQVRRDVAAVDAREARDPLGGNEWKAASQAWHGGARAETPAASSTLVDGLAALFPTVADRSRLTYDPNIAGIDIADSLTYRLPIALQQLERARLALCATGATASSAVAGRLALSRSAGHAEGYLSDGLSETAEAATLNPEFESAIGNDQRRAQASTAFALSALDAFERHPDVATRAAATREVERGIDDLYTLLRDTAPALGRLVDQRRDALAYRRFETIALGIIAIVAATMIVLLGARSALHRAELGRIRRSADELRHHATHDMLTGLPNRTALVAHVDAALEREARTAATVAVLFIDLDNFKLVNDSLGHEAGDSVLSSVSRRLQAIVADVDGALVARFGGDEFAMMLCASSAERMRSRVDAVVAEIAATLAHPVVIRAPFDRHVVITASVGIAFLDGGLEAGRGTVDLLREADAAMYEAKANGRAHAEAFGPAMRERATKKLTLMSDLPGASERGEFSLEFQPFVRLADGETFGSEALIRWHHPKLGLLLPNAFLPVAEESGSLVRLGRWAIDEALRRFASGDAPAGSVHVNLSVRELLDDALDIVVAEALERYGVAPSSLAIEVLEGSLIRSGDPAERMLRRLRAMGAKIWIDDFGVEYSSLRYLHTLPIDGFKIDRTFVGAPDGSLAAPSIVRLIVELGRSLELGVVAEGIETERQREALLELGCIHGQGFLFTPASARVPLARSNFSRI